MDLASLRHLEDTLDRLQRGGSLRATTPRFDLYLDEFGYQTNPPDRLLGVTPGAAGRVAAAVRLHRVARPARAQPDPVRLAGRAGQPRRLLLGLAVGPATSPTARPKPALAHFALPFFVDVPRGRLWGQVRPGDGVQKVDVLRKLKGSTTWRRIDTIATDANGYWSKKLRLTRGASYRFQWGDSLSAKMTV